MKTGHLLLALRSTFGPMRRDGQSLRLAIDGSGTSGQTR
jgi:hypothetical protein